MTCSVSSNCTLNIAFGSASVTVPSSSSTSFLGLLFGSFASMAGVLWVALARVAVARLAAAASAEGGCAELQHSEQAASNRARLIESNTSGQSASVHRPVTEGPGPSACVTEGDGGERLEPVGKDCNGGALPLVEKFRNLGGTTRNLFT